MVDKRFRYTVTQMEINELNLLSHIIYRTRRLMSITQYGAAKYLKMKLNRLRNLENGNYRRMPNDEEIEALHNFYGIPIKTLVRYAQNEINDHKETRAAIKCDLPNVHSAV